MLHTFAQALGPWHTHMLLPPRPLDYHCCLAEHPRTRASHHAAHVCTGPYTTRRALTSCVHRTLAHTHAAAASSAPMPPQCQRRHTAHAAHSHMWHMCKCMCIPQPHVHTLSDEKPAYHLAYNAAHMKFVGGHPLIVLTCQTTKIWGPGCSVPQSL